MNTALLDTVRTFAFIAAALLVRPGGLAAQSQYKGIPFPPYEFYEAVLNQCGDENYNALGRSMEHLAPLLDAIQARLGADPRAEIASAIAEKDAEKTRAALLRLIFLDLKLNLEEAGRAAAAARRNDLLQMAYTNYYFLSHEVSRRDRALDRELRDAFKEAYAAGDSARSSQAIGHLVGMLSPIFCEPARDGAS